MTDANAAQAESTTQQWVAGSLAGNASALTSLVGLLTPIVRARIARLLMRSVGRQGRDIASEVDDLSQEFFLHLFSSDGRLLRNWEPLRGLSLENYVGLLATRATISTLRSRKKSPYTEQPADPSTLAETGGQVRSAGESVDSRDLLERLATELRARLTETGFEMFYRLYVWEQTPKEIEDQTGMRLEAIYQWRTRLAKRAREVRSELLGSDNTHGPATSHEKTRHAECGTETAH